MLDTDWDSLVWHAHDRDRMNTIITAWTQRFSDPHLPTTLKRRLKAAGFDVEAIDIVPVLNADFDPDSYSARHIEIISDYVTQLRLMTPLRGRTTCTNAPTSASTSSASAAISLHPKRHELLRQLFL